MSDKNYIMIEGARGCVIKHYGGRGRVLNAGKLHCVTYEGPLYYDSRSLVEGFQVSYDLSNQFKLIT